MGGPTFRSESVKGLDPDYDPWGLFSNGGLTLPPGGQTNRVFGDRQLRLNTFDGDPTKASYHYVRAARADALRKKIVSVALKEWKFWQQDDGSGTPTEDDGGKGRERVKLYWKAVGKNNSTIAQPWSAAFISYVMKEAGALPDFRRAQKHTTYFYHAKQARREKYGSLFKAYPASGKGAVVPEVGDLIANERANKPRSYDRLKPEGVSHSDIVVAKAYRLIVVVGGNVSAGRGKGNKVVGKKYILLDSAGNLQSVRYLRPDATPSPSAPRYWSVMKIEAQTSNLLQPGAKR